MSDKMNPELAVRHLLHSIGEDHTREGLIDTPRRVVKALSEMTSGYKEKPDEILSVVFKEKYDEMIAVNNLTFWSMCEHHMLPFTGKACIAYIPNGKVVGLSKLARLLHCFSRRLQIQERMTQQIAHAIQDHLEPLGVGVFITAKHSCMAMRGVKTEGDMVTSALLGSMREHAVRTEFLKIAKSHG